MPPSLSLVFVVLLIGAADPTVERVVPADGRIEARIGEVPVTLRLDPGAPAMPMLDPAAARRIGLKPGPIGVGHRIGSARVTGRTAVARIRLTDGAEIRRRVGWMTAPYAADVDGVIGPGGLGEMVVRFELRTPRPEEVDLILPLAKQDGIGGGWSPSVGKVQVGGAPILVRFDPRQPRTLATAGAAARLAEHHGGVMVGEAGSAMIAFGVTRPVRRMTLSRPLALGPLSITALTVRTQDFGSVAAIPDAKAEVDPDEVLVTGKGKRDRSKDLLTLGADTLDRCSSITFDKTAQQVRLRCS